MKSARAINGCYRLELICLWFYLNEAVHSDILGIADLRNAQEVRIETWTWPYRGQTMKESMEPHNIQINNGDSCWPLSNNTITRYCFDVVLFNLQSAVFVNLLWDYCLCFCVLIDVCVVSAFIFEIFGLRFF